MKTDIQNLVNHLAQKEKKIIELEDRLSNLENQFSCSPCASKVNSEAKLKKHPVNPQEQMVECSNTKTIIPCDYTSKSSTTLERHITLKHRVDENHAPPAHASPPKEACTICGKL